MMTSLFDRLDDVNDFVVEPSSSRSTITNNNSSIDNNLQSSDDDDMIKGHHKHQLDLIKKSTATSMRNHVECQTDTIDDDIIISSIVCLY
jgi:hypothetical protein